MTSLYDELFDDIPLFAVEGTEDSDVIVYETNEQRNLRLMNEHWIARQQKEIERLMNELQIFPPQRFGR